jgi:lantibiotic modifying enzyme
VTERTAQSDRYREIAESAVLWVLSQVREDDGPWLLEAVPASGAEHVAIEPTEDRDSLYSGIGGIALLLAEIAQGRALSGAEDLLRVGIAERLRKQAAARVDPGLYFGLASDATALHVLDPGSEQIALNRLNDLATPTGWASTEDLGVGIAPGAPINDVVSGSAGVMLAGTWIGGDIGRRIATSGGDALLAAADTSPDGLQWLMVAGHEALMPNYSHGIAGIATALAIAGHDLGRDDYIDAARRGATRLVALGVLSDETFVVPIQVPHGDKDFEPITYSWCHGATGTSMLFPALRRAGVSEIAGVDVNELRRRSLQSILTSGVPDRLRPGFWDNDGRCCGTAGAGDTLLDAAQDATSADQANTFLDGAVTMADALVTRAITDEVGTRWRFTEHRNVEPLLPPETTWMQGAAGIAAFLLRVARVLEQGPDASVVDRPDEWWCVPSRLRVSGS